MKPDWVFDLSVLDLFYKLLRALFPQNVLLDKGRENRTRGTRKIHPLLPAALATSQSLAAKTLAGTALECAHGHPLLPVPPAVMVWADVSRRSCWVMCGWEKNETYVTCLVWRNTWITFRPPVGHATGRGVDLSVDEARNTNAATVLGPRIESPQHIFVNNQNKNKIPD